MRIEEGVNVRTRCRWLLPFFWRLPFPLLSGLKFPFLAAPAAVSVQGVSVCRLSASNTVVASVQGVSVRRLLASNAAAVLLSGVLVCRLLASNTAAVSAIWRVSLPPLGEQYCR